MKFYNKLILTSEYLKTQITIKFQALIWGNLASEYQMLYFSFLRKKVPFFLDLLILNCIFRTFSCANAFLNSFPIVLPMICQLYPESISLILISFELSNWYQQD